MSNLQRLIINSLLACLLPLLGLYFIYVLIRDVYQRTIPVTAVTWIILAALVQSSWLTTLFQ